MKVAFFGMFGYGSLALQGLLKAGFTPACVITVPQDPHREPYFPHVPLQELARAHDLPLHEPKSVKTEEFKQLLASYEPEIAVIALFDKLLPAAVLSIPPLGFLNAHPSLLPAYRGPTPHNWVLVEGEKETGVTIHKVNPEMDAGEILLQHKVPLAPTDTADKVMHKLAQAAAEALPEALRLVETGQATFTPQSLEAATYFPRRRKAYAVVRWWRPAEEIYNLYRGMLPRPRAFTFHHSRELELLEVELASPDASSLPAEAGRVLRVDETGLLVQAVPGQLLLKRLVVGGEILEAQAYAARFKLKPGDHLG